MGEKKTSDRRGDRWLSLQHKPCWWLVLWLERGARHPAAAQHPLASQPAASQPSAAAQHPLASQPAAAQQPTAAQPPASAIEV